MIERELLRLCRVLFIWLISRIHWHICEAHFQLMFDKECLPARLFFVRRKGHFPKSLCWSCGSFSSYYGLLFGNQPVISRVSAFHFRMPLRFLSRIHQGLFFCFFNHFLLINGLTLAVASAEPIVGLREVRVEYFLKYQVDTLADYPIHHYGYA